MVSFASEGTLTPRAIDITPDGSRVIAAGDDGLRVFDIDGRTEEQHVAIQGAHSVACHPDGEHIVINGDQGLFRFRLNGSKGGALTDRETLAGASRGVLRALAQSADGARLAAVVGVGKVLLIDFADGSRRALNTQRAWPGVAVRGDGQIVAAFLPQHIGIWRFDTGQRVATIATTLTAMPT